MDCNEKQHLYLSDKVKSLNGTPAVTLESKEIDLHKTLTVHLENKVKELHSNVRHITQLGMTWFAFFVTINYLTIGWFAQVPSEDGKKINPFIIGAVAIVFILQNVLGIFGICKVRNTVKAGAAQVNIYEGWLLSIYKNWLQSTNTVSHLEMSERPSIPARLYELIALTLMIVLASLIGAWLFISGSYIFKW